MITLYQSLIVKLLQIKQNNESIENEFNKLKAFDSNYFIGKSYFEEDGTQSYLVFQSINKYFRVITSTDFIMEI